MKKKGFTLVELLVVITIIGLLIVIAVPSGLAISKKIKEKMLDTKIEIIEQGAIVYGQNNKTLLNGTCNIEGNEYDKCLITTIDYLLKENALEEDKVENNNKLLINPVTNESLNSCTVYIYNKNKRVYAKYDINGTNCGYDKLEENIEEVVCKSYPCIILKENSENKNIAVLDSTTKMFNEYLDFSKDVDYLKQEIELGNYSRWIEPGYKIIDENKNIIATEEDEVLNIDRSEYVSITPNKKLVGYWDYTYSLKDIEDIKSSELKRVLEKKFVNSTKRRVFLKDDSAPLMISEKTNSEYQSGNEIVMYNLDDYMSYYKFDNYDLSDYQYELINRLVLGPIFGITSDNYDSSYYNTLLHSIDLADNAYNIKKYDLNIYIRPDNLPQIGYLGETTMYVDNAFLDYFYQNIYADDADGDSLKYGWHLEKCSGNGFTNCQTKYICDGNQYKFYNVSNNIISSNTYISEGKYILYLYATEYYPDGELHYDEVYYYYIYVIPQESYNYYLEEESGGWYFHHDCIGLGCEAGDFYYNTLTDEYAQFSTPPY